MTGIKDLARLLSTMEPVLHPDDFVFCTIPCDSLKDYTDLNPIGSFQEKEGLSLIITAKSAEENSIKYDCVFSLISLTIHSSLEAVGLTAAIAQKLTSRNISANVVAAYYHDHIFVPKNKTKEAMEALFDLQTGCF